MEGMLMSSQPQAVPVPDNDGEMRVHCVYYRNIIYTAKKGCCAALHCGEAEIPANKKSTGWAGFSRPSSLSFVYAGWQKSETLHETHSKPYMYRANENENDDVPWCCQSAYHVPFVGVMASVSRGADDGHGSDRDDAVRLTGRHLSWSWLSLGRRLRLLMLHLRQMQQALRTLGKSNGDKMMAIVSG